MVAAPLIKAGFFPGGAPTVPILMYHSVSDDPETGVSGYYRLATPPKTFRAQMQWLCDHGYRTIDLFEARDRLSNAGTNADRVVVITFDDGFRDFISTAWPVLESFSFVATMFLPTAFVGEQTRIFNGRECLTWSEVRALHRAGASFGAHTVHHPVLYTLPWVRIREELRGSKQMIEDRLGISIDAFAYPYAFPQEDPQYVRGLLDELRNVGYRAAVTTAVGVARCGDDPLRLRRLPVNGADDDALFGAKMEGGYDWVAWPQLLARKARRLAHGNRRA
jgi:peptidoglycan/xylan/chitin deacetylase (PgdA/CDA1 family)